MLQKATESLADAVGHLDQIVRGTKSASQRAALLLVRQEIMAADAEILRHVQNNTYSREK